MTKQKRVERLLQQIDETLMEEAKVRSKLRGKVLELTRILTL